MMLAESDGLRSILCWALIFSLIVCLVRDNISKTASELASVRFIGSPNIKIKNQ